MAPENKHETTAELPSGHHEIKRLQSPEGALYASSGEMYKSMVFGRDSLESADDLLRVMPEISKSVIRRMAELQGAVENPANAEEPGKIPHQHMQLFVDGHRIPESAETQMRQLAARWGGDENGFTYYGSLDATPLFARLVARHCFIHGSDILDQEVQARTGETITIQDSLIRSLDWITNHLESSELSLLEFRRLNDRHIVVQSWRDSGSGFMHADGKQANIDGFIAPLEVQGYAYDALKICGELFRYDPSSHMQDYADKWLSYADHLQRTTLKSFWLPEDMRFAMGIDRDLEWRPHAIQTPASSEGVLLDSRLLLDLSEEERRSYVEPIVRRLYSEEFLTDIGIRCRAKSTAALVPFADYHGAQAVWAKESYDFAKGLWRQGFNDLARDMSRRIMNMVNISGQYYEFLYVLANGDVDYRPKALSSVQDPSQLDGIIKGTNVPDTGQAWTVSAALGIFYNIQPKHRASTAAWSQHVEADVRGAIKTAPTVDTNDKVLEARKHIKNFAIDLEAGIAADHSWNPSWWA